MGLFDSVYVDCLACGVSNEMQSKGADEPYMARYTLENVPADVASDLRTEMICDTCGTVHCVDIDTMRRRGEADTVLVSLRLPVESSTREDVG